MPARAPSRIVSRPPSRRARSSIDVRPRWRERSSGSAGSKPAPSSATSSTSPVAQPDGDRATRPRGARRCAAPPGRSAAPRDRASPIAQLVVDLELDRHAVQALLQLDVLAQRAAQPVALEVGRPQLEDERAQLVQRLAARAPAARSHLARAAARVAVEQRRRGLGGQHQPEQLLAHHVVQLERQAVALGEHRQLAAALVQARVGDRDRGVRGEQLDELLVGVVEGVGALLVA